VKIEKNKEETRDRDEKKAGRIRKNKNTYFEHEYHIKVEFVKIEYGGEKAHIIQYRFISFNAELFVIFSCDFHFTRFRREPGYRETEMNEMLLHKCFKHVVF
jgi:hypothetical protein